MPTLCLPDRWITNVCKVMRQSIRCPRGAFHVSSIRRGVLCIIHSGCFFFVHVCNCARYKNLPTFIGIIIIFIVMRNIDENIICVNRIATNIYLMFR